MVDQTITAGQVEALVTKLSGMDFTDDERTILQAVFRAAAGESEVELFAFDPVSLATFGIGLSMYKPQKADGSLDASVKYGYDLKDNKKI